jgi:hypothetical protein
MVHRVNDYHQKRQRPARKSPATLIDLGTLNLICKQLNILRRKDVAIHYVRFLISAWLFAVSNGETESGDSVHKAHAGGCLKKVNQSMMLTLSRIVSPTVLWFSDKCTDTDPAMLCSVVALGVVEVQNMDFPHLRAKHRQYYELDVIPTVAATSASENTTLSTYFQFGFRLGPPSLLHSWRGYMIHMAYGATVLPKPCITEKCRVGIFVTYAPLFPSASHI